MAEVANPKLSFGLWQQVRLVVGLRWMTFRNGLRSKSEKAHLVGTVALGLLFTLIALGTSIGIGFGTYTLVDLKRFGFLFAMLWGVFMFWQFFPVLASQTNPGFDGRNLLRFPLRFSAFLLMSIAYGLADPFALTAILWHIAMGIGISIARPDLARWAILALGASVAMNLLFNRMLFSWLERILAKRRTREIVAAVFILSMVSLQFSGIVVQRWGKPLKDFIGRTAYIWRALPPGEAGSVLSQAADGNTTGALRATGLLLLYSAVFGVLFAMRVHAQYTGEDLGESAAPARKKIAVRPASAPAMAELAAEDYTSNLVGAPVAAVFGKELRYLYRNSMLLMNLFLPLILIVFFSMSFSRPTRHGAPPIFSKFSSNMAYPAAIAYIFLLITQFFPNNLAYEGRGIERLFLSPVKFRDVMIGKNLFHGTLLALEAVLALGIVSAMGHAPRLPIVLATWAALPFAAFIHFSIGNWLSLQYPRRFEYGVRRQRPSGMTMLISFGVFFAVNGMLVAIGAICLWLANVWVLAVLYAGLSAAGFMVYRVALADSSRQAVAQRETLIDQLAK